MLRELCLALQRTNDAHHGVESGKVRNMDQFDRPFRTRNQPSVGSPVLACCRCGSAATVLQAVTILPRSLFGSQNHCPIPLSKYSRVYPSAAVSTRVAHTRSAGSCKGSSVTPGSRPSRTATLAPILDIASSKRDLKRDYLPRPFYKGGATAVLTTPRSLAMHMTGSGSA
jgi:hypothetical protein